MSHHQLNRIRGRRSKERVEETKDDRGNGTAEQPNAKKQKKAKKTPTASTTREGSDEEVARARLKPDKKTKKAKKDREKKVVVREASPPKRGVEGDEFFGSDDGD